jgi:hypothetical protein
LRFLGCFAAVHAPEIPENSGIGDMSYKPYRRTDMAENKGQQGTGRHPHKSTEEPYPHTKEEGTAHGRSQGSGGSQGRSHDGGSHSQSHGGGRDDNRSHAGSQGRSHESQSQGREQEDDLKSREYRGEDGQIHHHTRTYMEQHGGERGSGSGSHSGGSQGGDRNENRSHGQSHGGGGDRRH